MQRPTGVTILAVLAFIGAGLSVLVAIAAFLGGAVMSSMMANPRFGMLAGAGAVIVGVFLLGIVVMDVVIGFGLWKLQNWARILTIVLAGLALLSSVLSIVNPFAHMVHMFYFAFLIRHLITAAIEVWILVYLFKPHVKQAFGATGF